MENLTEFEKEAKKDIAEAATDAVLSGVELKWLGRKGKLTVILRSLKDMSQTERKTIGREANALRQKLEHIFKERRAELRKKDQGERFKKEKIDVTEPGKEILVGRLHPLTRAMREIVAIFGSLGFIVAEGPEIETEWYNFDALNIPEDHPARDMWDTFWLHGNQKFKIQNSKFKIDRKKHERLLLRTHTSPVQIRYMECHEPPFRIIAPGKVFRYEASDAAHDIEFYQVEGLMVDKDISVANFKNVIHVFLNKFFKQDVSIRMRPSFFPFTEPSFEIDLKRRGETKWLEVAGAGMVHPNVFKNAGFNPKELQGFAFGVGVDRLSMLKYKIPDIRLFHSSDIRFLKQF